MRNLKRVIVPVTIVAVVLAALAGFGLHARASHAAAAISSSCGQWAIVPGANPGAFNDQLFGVSAVSANDVWAVGDEGPQAGGPNSTLTEHWNGTAWNLVTSLNVSNAEQNVLESVAAVSASDVWAVGSYLDNTTSNLLTLTEHWNGTSWSIVLSPNAGQDGGELNGVSADAGNDAWAVGSYDDPTANASFTLIEHWNGTGWAIVPNPSGSPSDATLNSVVALSPTNVWAAGEYFGGTSEIGTLIEHWNGTSWSIVSSPNGSPVDNYLYGVTATGPNDIWAVGYENFASSTQLASLIEHWNGTSWTVVPGYTDGPNSPALRAASSVPGSSQILAVGHEYVGSNDVSLAVRWNGTTWTRTQTANGSLADGLWGVTATSAANAWAVGSYVPSSSVATSASMRMRHAGPYSGIPQERVLILHYVAPAHGTICA